jgi:hypothetical protein
MAIIKCLKSSSYKEPAAFSGTRTSGPATSSHLREQIINDDDNNNNNNNNNDNDSEDSSFLTRDGF